MTYLSGFAVDGHGPLDAAVVVQIGAVPGRALEALPGPLLGALIRARLAVIDGHVRAGIIKRIERGHVQIRTLTAIGTARQHGQGDCQDANDEGRNHSTHGDL